MKRHSLQTSEGIVGVVCKWIKKENILIPQEKKHFIISVYKYGFLLCNKLSENYDE